jgi:hypothetical protein
MIIRMIFDTIVDYFAEYWQNLHKIEIIILTQG